MTTAHIESLHKPAPKRRRLLEAALPHWRSGCLYHDCIRGSGIVVFLVDPSPTTVIGYFQLFQKSTLLGLLALDLVYMVSQLLMGLLLLALCVALRRANPR